VDAPSGDRAAQLTDTDIEPRFVLPSESLALMATVAIPVAPAATTKLTV